MKKGVEKGVEKRGRKGKAAVARTSSPTVSPFSLVYLTVSPVIFVFVVSFVLI